MDLELMFPSIISLRTANWEKRMKLLKNLLVLVIAYLVFIVISVIYIFLQYFVPHSFRIIPLASLQLNNHMSLIKLTSLQLNHHMSLIKLTLLQLHHHTSLIKLTSISSLYFTYSTCSKLITSPNPVTVIITLSHSRIPSSSLVTIHFQISSGFQLSYPTPTFVSPFHISVPTTVSNNAWDPSKVLLLFGDVESNPGPRPIDPNPVFCTICSSKINRGIQQETAPTFLVTDCNARCHQACNGLSINQTCHAKSCGRTITGKCPQHGTAIAEIIIPPPPVYEMSNRPSAVGKLCSVATLT